MEALLIYIAKSSGLVVLFYCAYYFLLRKETFFNSNRWFLLLGLITAAILPLIMYTKVIWINAAPITNMNAVEADLAQNSNDKAFEINWFYLLLAVYSIGFVVLLIKFAMDFFSLHSILKGKKIQQQADFKFIDTNENIAPFSYFEYIVYNSSMYTSSELENIIEHEKVHSDQNHTVDVLISRAFCMLFWFNPVIWLYRKAITQNLEFIADKEAAAKLSDKKAYQYTLLKITTHETCVAITNHFYQSLIKKRIVMLNKNQSKKRNSWKYYVVIPVLTAFVVLFQIEVIAKEKQPVLKETAEKIKSLDVYKIRKSSTDSELKEIQEKLKSIHNIDFSFSEIKRNSQSNLTSIKVDVKIGTQESQSIQTGGSREIKDFGIAVTTNEDGTKKVGIQIDESKNDTKSSEKPKTVISNKLKTKIDTNVSNDPNTSEKINNNSDTNISTVITTNTNSGSTTKVSTTAGHSKVVISNSSKTDDDKKIVIVNGEKMPSNFDLEDLNARDIKTMSVFKGMDAIAKYGDEGKHGVIVIETRN